MILSFLRLIFFKKVLQANKQIRVFHLQEWVMFSYSNKKVKSRFLVSLLLSTALLTPLTVGATETIHDKMTKALKHQNDKQFKEAIDLLEVVVKDKDTVVDLKISTIQNLTFMLPPGADKTLKETAETLVINVIEDLIKNGKLTLPHQFMLTQLCEPLFRGAKKAEALKRQEELMGEIFKVGVPDIVKFLNQNTGFIPQCISSFTRLGKIAEAKEIFEKTKENLKFEQMTMIASTYQLQGNFEETFNIFKSVVEHKDTATDQKIQTIKNLSYVFSPGLNMTIQSKLQPEFFLIVDNLIKNEKLTIPHQFTLTQLCDAISPGYKGKEHLELRDKLTEKISKEDPTQLKEFLTKNPSIISHYASSLERSGKKKEAKDILDQTKGNLSIDQKSGIGVSHLRNKKLGECLSLFTEIVKDKNATPIHKINIANSLSLPNEDKDFVKDSHLLIFDIVEDLIKDPQLSLHQQFSLLPLCETLSYGEKKVEAPKLQKEVVEKISKVKFEDLEKHLTQVKWQIFPYISALIDLKMKTEAEKIYDKLKVNVMNNQQKIIESKLK